MNPSAILKGRGVPVALATVVDRILAARRTAPSARSLLVAVSGIDASGKKHVTARIVRMLRSRGQRAVAIHVDDWLDLPGRRSSAVERAEHFYLQAIRFEALFAELVLPLRARRSLRVEANLAEETAHEFRRHLLEFEDVDIIVLEGIFLLKRALRDHYDLSIWLDCSFETALERAVTRAQEGLPPGQTVEAYRRIYFPAQQIHFERDDPRAAATHVVDNDSRSSGKVPAPGSPAHRTAERLARSATVQEPGQQGHQGQGDNA